jgi:hypothetical protein
MTALKSEHVHPAMPSHTSGARAEGPELVHQIKHRGYRLIVRRDSDRSCTPDMALTGATATP